MSVLALACISWMRLADTVEPARSVEESHKKFYLLRSLLGKCLKWHRFFKTKHLIES